MLRKSTKISPVIFEADDCDSDSEGSSNFVPSNLDHNYASVEIHLPTLDIPDDSSARFCSVSQNPSSYEEGLEYAKEYLTASVKSSTRTQYDRIYRIWQDFCSENGFPEFGAGYKAVASCLSLEMKNSGSYSKVSMLSAAIANEHRRHLLPSPTAHECISQLFRGFKLCNLQSRQPVLPLTEEIIKQMIDRVYLPCHGRSGLKAPLVLWRTVWRALMEFHTLGRYSDIVRLQRPGADHLNNELAYVK